MEVFMNITKYETNLKRNLFMHETSNSNFKPDVFKEENKIINIYPFLEFQEILGFGRCSYSVLLAIIYLLVLKKFVIAFWMNIFIIIK